MRFIVSTLVGVLKHLALTNQPVTKLFYLIVQCQPAPIFPKLFSFLQREIAQISSRRSDGVNEVELQTYSPPTPPKVIYGDFQPFYKFESFDVAMVEKSTTTTPTPEVSVNDVVDVRTAAKEDKVIDGNIVDEEAESVVMTATDVSV